MRALLLSLGVVLAGCGTRSPIETDRLLQGVNDGSFCPVTPVDGMPCPAAQAGCTFFETDDDRGCVTASTCRCEGGKTVGCAPIGVCSTGGGSPTDRCAPGLPCGATRIGCVVESCGRACSCGADGVWECGPDTCS
jgi:hypothetical protein